MNTRILRLSDVRSRVGLSRSSIYLKMQKSEFPRQIELGERCVGWIESEIDDWIEARIFLSRPSAIEADDN